MLPKARFLREQKMVPFPPYRLPMDTSLLDSGVRLSTRRVKSPFQNMGPPASRSTPLGDSPLLPAKKSLDLRRSQAPRRTRKPPCAAGVMTFRTHQTLDGHECSPSHIFQHLPDSEGITSLSIFCFCSIPRVMLSSLRASTLPPPPPTRMRPRQSPAWLTA